MYTYELQTLLQDEINRVTRLNNLYEKDTAVDLQICAAEKFSWLMKNMTTVLDGLELTVIKSASQFLLQYHIDQLKQIN